MNLLHGVADMHEADEFFHSPGGKEYWSESHYFDAIDTDADVALHGRVGFYPNRDVANVFFFLVTGGTVYWVREEAVDPADTHGLTVEGPEWTVEMVPVDPPAEWRVRVEGTVTATRAGDPGAVLDAEGGSARLDLECSLTSRHDPFYYSEGETFPDEPNNDRYEVATRVEGEATVDGETVAFSGVGERDHSWGRRKWAGDAEWLWISGAFEDGTAYNHLSFWLAGHSDQRMVNGFWYDGETTHAITGSNVTATPAFGPDTARGWMTGGAAPGIELELAWDDGGTTLDVGPFVTTPVDWVDGEREQRAVLNRAAARQTRDGDVPGAGFLENITQLPLGGE